MSDATVIEITDDGLAKVLDGAPDDGAGTSGTGALEISVSDDPAAGIEEMRRQLSKRDEDLRLSNEALAGSQRAAADAERRAREAAQEAARVSAAADEGQFQQIVGALAANESQMESLQQQKATALESGDYTKVAALDGQMTKVGARIVSLENGKAVLEEQRKNAPARPDPSQQPISQVEQNEAFLSRLAPKAQNWIRQHPEFFSNPSFQTRVMAAAQHAEAIRHLSPNDDAYYDAIEIDLGLKAAPQQQQQQAPQQQNGGPATAAQPTSTAAAATSRQSAVPVAAAPSRSLPDGGGAREPSRRIVLSLEQRQMAHMNEPDKDPREAEAIYAKNLYALQKEGKIAY